MARRCSLTLVLVLALCGAVPTAALAGTLPTITLSPGGGFHAVGAQHTETVTFDDNGTPVQGNVHYVRTGANSVGDTVVSTDATGHVDIVWTGTNPGSDTLRVYQDVNANNGWDSGEPTDTAFVTFSAGSLFISTGSQDNIGAEHSATFTLEDADSNPRQDVTIHYTISGPNGPIDDTTATNQFGQATIMWTGTNAGTDTLSAWYDFDGDTVQDATDPSDTAFVDFNFGNMSITGSATGFGNDADSTGFTGASYTATVQLTDAVGDPRSGAPVRYAINGAPNPTPVTTNSSGNASITWTRATRGTDQLTAYYDENGNSVQDPDEPGSTHFVNWITSIVSSGPITAINLDPTMGCQAFYSGDTAGEFYGDVPGSCGTYVYVDGALRGPGSLMPVSQTERSGSGTSGDPFRVVTVACAGNSTACGAGTAPLVTQTVTYVSGRDYYRIDVNVAERSGSAKPAAIYQYADCYLQGSDDGYGFYDSSSGGIYCSANPHNSPAGRIEGFVPLSSGSSYYENGYSPAYSAMNAGAVLPNTCDCTTLRDNGMTLGYAVDLPAGGSVTRSLVVAFSPTGNAVDVVAPDVTLTSPAAGSTTTDHTPTLAGGAGSQPGDSDTVTVNIYSGSSASGGAAHSIPVTRSGGSWSVDSPNLASGTYTAQAVQSDSEGNTGTSAAVTFAVTDPVTPPGPPPGDIDGFLTPPPPEVGKKVNVEPTKGTVLVKLPGSSKFINLADAESIPVGTTIDTKKGTVRMTSAADSKGRTQSGTFYQGVFVVRQARAKAPITQLQLTGKENFRTCPRSSTRRSKASASRPKRRLWGNAKGRFSTKGRYAAATVRGTQWYTEDNCSGTLVKVKKGVVAVKDLTKKKTFNVKAGKSYLAKAK